MGKDWNGKKLRGEYSPFPFISCLVVHDMACQRDHPCCICRTMNLAVVYDCHVRLRVDLASQKWY